ncbi:MAG: hypothetical protein QE271_05185 [Bacteriovoracaceae bacterium]|nr:hypothetical protein [Bacteriovoracaceae bacterium]
MSAQFLRGKWLFAFLFAIVHVNLFAQQASFSNTLSFDDPALLDKAMAEESKTIRLGDWTKSPFEFSPETVCYLVLLNKGDRKLTALEENQIRWFGKLPTVQEQVENDFYGRVKIVQIEVVLFKSLDPREKALLQEIYPHINFQDAAIAKKYWKTLVSKLTLSQF